MVPSNCTGKVSFTDLEALGLVDHPDCHRHADNLIARNFPDDYTGADRLHVRTRVNQIGQIPAPVAQGVGYTLLPRSGLAAFPDAERLRIAVLPERRYLELWSITPRGHRPGAALDRIMAMIRSLASDLA